MIAVFHSLVNEELLKYTKHICFTLFGGFFVCLNWTADRREMAGNEERDMGNDTSQRQEHCSWTALSVGLGRRSSFEFILK